MKALYILSTLVLVGIFVVLTLLLVIQNEQNEIARTQLQISRQSYISGLISSYNNEMAACRSAAREAEPENLNSFIQENCLNPINESRVAGLLKEWGQEDVLVTVAE